MAPRLLIACVIFASASTLLAQTTAPPSTTSTMFLEMRTKDGPTTQPATSQMPADEAMSDLMNLATAPSTQPGIDATTQPASPLVNKGRPEDARPMTMTLSNGQVLRGHVSTTPDRPLRIWDETIKDYRDVPFQLIKSVAAKVVWERDEPEFAFRESGSDVKVFSGRTYPARETVYVITLLNGETITGGVVAPLFVDADGETRTYVLHKRDKGEPGKKLAELVYVKTLELHDPRSK